MLERNEGDIPSQENKATPEQVKHLGEFVQEFSFVPGKKPILGSIFEGPTKSEGPISTELKFISTAPVMEALSLRLRQLYKEAFDEHGEMLNYDRVLDINGLLLFLVDFYDSAERSGHRVKKENLAALEDALSDLDKYIEQDPYSE